MKTHPVKTQMHTQEMLFWLIKTPQLHWCTNKKHIFLLVNLNSKYIYIKHPQNFELFMKK